MRAEEGDETIEELADEAKQAQKKVEEATESDDERLGDGTPGRAARGQG